MTSGTQTSNSLHPLHEPNVQLLGKNAWNQAPGIPLLSLLFVLDLSLFWGMSSSALTLLSDPWEGSFPLLLSAKAHSLSSCGAALILVLGATLAQKKVTFPLLPSALLWAIRTSPVDLKFRRTTYFGPARWTLTVLLTLLLIGSSITGVCWIHLRQNLSALVLESWKKPTLDRAQTDPLSPNPTSETQTLPLFTLLTHWPLKEVGGEPYLLSLPFSQKIPEKYLPYARLQQPRLGIQIEVQGPKSISLPLGESLPQFALQRVSEKIHDRALATGKRKSFQSFRNPLSPLSAPNAQTFGVRIQGSQQELETSWIGSPEEYILLSVEEKLPRLGPFNRAPSEWVLQKNIQAARTYLNQELAQMKLPKEAFLPDWIRSGKTTPSPSLNESEFLALFRAEHLIGAKLTLDPGSLESWYHFGGVNFWIREASLKREAPELARLAERNFQVALQSLQHLAPQHPLTKELSELKALLIQRLQEGS